MMMLLVTGLVATAAIAPSHDSAAARAALEQMRHYAPYREAVQHAYQDYEKSLSGHCPAVAVDPTTAHARVAAPLQLDAQGGIDSGIWTEQMRGVACGETRRFTALVIFRGGNPSVYPVFPGDSFASPRLQRDATVSVASALTVSGAKCVPEVLDTRLPQGVPTGSRVPWNETWIVRSCDETYRVPVRFIPDATGTGFDIDPKSIQRLPVPGN